MLSVLQPRRLAAASVLLASTALLALSPASAHFDSGSRYTYTSSSCGSGSRVDPINVVFYTWGTWGRAESQVQSHAGWSNTSGSMQYFADHGSCYERHTQRASGCGTCSRYHVRIRGQHSDPTLGWPAAASAQHEDWVPSCNYGIGGHAVDSNGPNGSGFDQGARSSAMRCRWVAITTTTPGGAIPRTSNSAMATTRVLTASLRSSNFTKRTTERWLETEDSLCWGSRASCFRQRYLSLLLLNSAVLILPASHHREVHTPWPRLRRSGTTPSTTLATAWTGSRSSQCFDGKIRRITSRSSMGLAWSSPTQDVRHLQRSRPGPLAYGALPATTLRSRVAPLRRCGSSEVCQLPSLMAVSESKSILAAL